MDGTLLPPRRAEGGRAQRVDEGFDIWVPIWDIGSWFYGLRGKKHISDDSVDAIFRSPDWIRIKFDGDDEIMIRDDILKDVPDSALERLTILDDFPLDLPLQNRIDEMQARQATRASLSWPLRRSSDGAKAPVWPYIRWIIPASIVILVVVRILQRSL